ncbi:MAG: hypothetical protein K9G64_03935 [Bacteroidia bacterium]|nr:hypothetical protein [Bacteroidia bacterium]
MKPLIKYFVTILVSVLFFIVGDIAVKGAWLNKIDNPEFVISHKLGIDKSNPKIILVKIIPEEGLLLNNKIIEGLQIQLMNTEYKKILCSTVSNGFVQFDISNLKKNTLNFILISPLTGNELLVDATLRNFEMKLDLSEININQKANKNN